VIIFLRFLNKNISGRDFDYQRKKSNKELIRVKVEQKRMKRKNLLPGINKINPMINDSMNRLTIGQMIEVSFNLREITFSTENHVISTYSLGK